MGGPEQRSTLLEDLETMHRNLKELESVKAYVQVIHRALRLRYVLSSKVASLAKWGMTSEAAIQQAQGFSSHSSVSEYAVLQVFVSSVVEKCAVVKDQQSLHLVSFIQHLRDKTWNDIKGVIYA